MEAPTQSVQAQSELDQQLALTSQLAQPPAEGTNYTTSSTMASTTLAQSTELAKQSNLAVPTVSERPDLIGEFFLRSFTQFMKPLKEEIKKEPVKTSPEMSDETKFSPEFETLMKRYDEEGKL
jgi:hypothetical protein